MTIELAEENASYTNTGLIDASPAVTLSGDGTTFTNWGRVVSWDVPSTIEISGNGGTVVNYGSIEGSFLSTVPPPYDQIAIRSSAGADSVTNSGSIYGAVRLGAGDDSFVDLQGNQSIPVDLGEGDDQYRLEAPSTRVFATVEGGNGYDTFLLQGHADWVDLSRAVSFEALRISALSPIVYPKPVEVEQANGFSVIDIASGVSIALDHSRSPDADLHLNGSSVDITDLSALKNVIGSDRNDSVGLSGDSVVGGAIALGGGDDTFFLGGSDTATRPVVADGGDGWDTITVASPSRIPIDLSRITGFEHLVTGYGEVAFSSASGLVDLSVTGFVTISHSDLGLASLDFTGSGLLTIAADTRLGRIGAPDAPLHKSDLAAVQTSVNAVATFDNAGLILGDVQLGMGMDFFYNTGSVGGTVYGYAGDDTLSGSQDDDRFDGGYGNDWLTGGLGNDALNGGPGTDVAAFSAASTAASLQFEANGSYLLVSPDGADTLQDIERLHFSDRDVWTDQFGIIDQAYLAYGGRDANFAELIHWSDAIAAGGSASAIRAAIIDDPLGAGAIDAAYEELFGRAAMPAEIEVWRNLFRQGADLNSLRSAILSEAPAIARADAAIGSFYQDFGGRAPSEAEIGFWRGQLAGGSTLAEVRTAIIDDPLGASHIVQIYQDFFGRSPTAEEIKVWQGLFASGADASALPAAILSEPAGRNHVVDVIAGTYEDLGGRAPISPEIETWLDNLRHDGSYHVLRSAILNDASLGAHATALIHDDYQNYFGRRATDDEVAVWRKQFAEGVSTDTLLDTLFVHPDGVMGGVVSAAGQAGADTFQLGSAGHLLVTGFDPGADVIDLKQAGYAYDAPLAHAREVAALDGRTDVFISWDPGHDILLTGVSVAALSTGNFLVQ